VEACIWSYRPVNTNAPGLVKSNSTLSCGVTEGKPYLIITESRKKEDKRSSIMVFPEDAGEFFAALEVMMKKL
jgi:hypothetical protein